MEPLTIFYSWQSDLPNSTNRGLIQQALKNAVQDLNRGDAVSMELAVDRDTQNVQGARHIAETILEKIRRAAIFVCDVSFINSQSINPEDQDRPRLTPNPNVLIELGYAFHALGDDRILLVFNNAFGKVEDLPFDIRFRKVLQYTSYETDHDRATVRNPLIGQLKSILPAMIKSVETTRHINMQELINKATEFHRQRIEFVNKDEECLQVNSIKPFLLFHVIPLYQHGGESIIDLGREEVREQCEMVHPFMRFPDSSRISRGSFKNKIEPKYMDEKDGDYRRSYSQIFVDGTIEFADVYLLSDAAWNIGTLKKGFRIPAIDIATIKATRRALRFYQSQNITAPVAFFLTLCNAEGLSILMDERGDLLGRPLVGNEPLTFRGAIMNNIADLNAVEIALKPILAEICQCFGLPSSLSYLDDGSLHPLVARKSKLD
ncbi:hypothetical protein [Herpetosiphon geysericola]|uniref:hypothetical protein n=1 Tax=Herpetosiphon geysericola TaxID=70996 RepID=UPI0006C9085A|nr:hypothetical protein [Herpetosiphon geysericola]